MEDKNELIVPESNDLSILTDPEKVAKAREELNKESLALISKIVEETSIEKTKDLTHLFNVNQKGERRNEK